MTDEELEATFAPVAVASAEAVRLGLAAGPDDAMRGWNNITLVRWQWVARSGPELLRVGPPCYTLAALWRVMERYGAQFAHAFLASETHSFDVQALDGRLAFEGAFRELVRELRNAVQ